MDGHLSDRPSYKEPTGTESKWMWNKLQAWRKRHFAQLHDDDPEIRAAAESMYNLEYATLLRVEENDALFQGRMKALKERAYRESMGIAQPDEGLYYVTVNPAPEVPLEKFEKVTEKYVKAAHVEGTEYVYEQRGSTEAEAGKGMHMHMLVKTNTKPSDFKKRTRNAFKNIVGNDAHIWIMSCPKAYINDKRVYMQGYKTGEGKAEKVAVDRIWRPQNNLQEYYITGNAIDPPPSPDPEHTQRPSQADDSHVEEEPSCDEPDSPVHSVV